MIVSGMIMTGVVVSGVPGPGMVVLMVGARDGFVPPWAAKR